MKNYFVLSFLIALINLNSLTPLLADNKPTPEQQEKRAPLTGQKLQIFAASAQDLLTLEDEPPSDTSSAVPVTAELQRDILNLLTLNEGFEDYFHLFTAKVGSYIDDQFTNENIYDPTGKVASVKYKHHYVVRPGKEHQVIGYLKCLDKEATSATVESVAAQKDSDKYYFHSDVGGTNKYLLINLQYGFLSQEEIDHCNLTYNAENNDEELYGIHYDLKHRGKRKTAEYVWIKEESHEGTIAGDPGFSSAPTQSNIFSLALWIQLDDTADPVEESSYNYDSVDSDKNACGIYEGYKDNPPKDNPPKDNPRTWSQWWNGLWSINLESVKN